MQQGNLRIGIHLVEQLEDLANAIGALGGGFWAGDQFRRRRLFGHAAMIANYQRTYY